MKFKIGDYVRLEINSSRICKIGSTPSIYGNEANTHTYDLYQFGKCLGWDREYCLLLVSKPEEFLCKIYEV